MVKYSIKIFARIKPTKASKVVYDVSEKTDDNATILSFNVPRLISDGVVNNKKELFQFKFNEVFDEATKQDMIFTQVAQPVINNCLEGYNGTIFAYGQTGSGKTFTITGGAERYADRGIIPRTLAYLFQEYQKRPEYVFTTSVSYLEIYNESGYDLLDPKHEASKLEDLPKVSLCEGQDGNIHLKNLSLHVAANEEEALNWLFIGDTNRIIAETPMNMASTRSHCIFTVHISAREAGAHTVKKAKLHLVDLAGSERVAKSGVNGSLLTEAKYINLSLHFLEQVIVALSEKSRSHIPYRNSMMTSVLRDSLGGNCMTTMIATVSIDKKNLEESLSTCRFAQRVALVKNEAILNEELDPNLMIARLKQQVSELQQEIALSTGEERTDELTDEEKRSVEKAVELFVNNEDFSSKLTMGSTPDMRKIHFAFQLMKRNLLTAMKATPKCVTPERIDQQQLATNNEELVKLQNKLHQRDEEINIILKMLKQERRKVSELSSGGIKDDSTTLSPPIMGRTTPIPLNRTSPSGDSGCVMTNSCATPTSLTGTAGSDNRTSLRIELSQARQGAFDIYKKDIGDSSLIEKHKIALRTKYSEAKALGEQVNSSRLNINKLKGVLEKVKVQHGLNQSVTDSTSEETIKDEMETEKRRFKDLCTKLKSLKTEIEHLQHLLEKSRLKLQSDFEEWWIRNSTNNKSLTLPHITSNTSVLVNSAADTNILTTSIDRQRQMMHSTSIRPYSKERTPTTMSSSINSGNSSNITSPRLTGDVNTDDDIIAFYKARQKLVAKT